MKALYFEFLLLKGSGSGGVALLQTITTKNTEYARLFIFVSV
jgi:hypothetical protein